MIAVAGHAEIIAPYVNRRRRPIADSDPLTPRGCGICGFVSVHARAWCCVTRIYKYGCIYNNAIVRIRKIAQSKREWKSSIYIYISIDGWHNISNNGCEATQRNKSTWSNPVKSDFIILNWWPASSIFLPVVRIAFCPAGQCAKPQQQLCVRTYSLVVYIIPYSRLICLYRTSDIISKTFATDGLICII